MPYHFFFNIICMYVSHLGGLCQNTPFLRYISFFFPRLVSDYFKVEIMLFIFVSLRLVSIFLGGVINSILGVL